MPYTYKELKENPEIYKLSKGPIILICENCGAIFKRSKKNIYTAMNKCKKTFCSELCRDKANNLSQTIECDWCHKLFIKKKNQIEKSKHNFCSHSCSCTYQNTHKTTGTRRSKLECWLEIELTKMFPNLEILYNNKETINSELDIYIPSLSLAFELNGIYHYEPIHGPEKLTSIKNNDTRKFQACIEKNIELCIIDSSQLNYFKPTKAQKYLDIIINIVNTKFAEGEGV